MRDILGLMRLLGGSGVMRGFLRRLEPQTVYLKNENEVVIRIVTWQVGLRAMRVGESKKAWPLRGDRHYQP